MSQVQFSVAVFAASLAAPGAGMLSGCSGDEHAGGLAYERTDLISDGSTTSPDTDAHLVNPWGISAAGASHALWVTDNGTGVVTQYSAPGSAEALSGPLVVELPLPPGSLAAHSAPAGIVSNPASTGFVLTEGSKSGSARWLVATEEGTIAAWNPDVHPQEASIVVDHSGVGAVYHGLAIGHRPSGWFVYAANFASGRIDVFDENFQLATDLQDEAFTDTPLPRSYAPFGLQILRDTSQEMAEDRLYVSYVQKAQDGTRAMPGPGNGMVNAFSLDGTLRARVLSQGPLNTPSSVAWAWGNGALLVGNLGDGRISVLDPSNYALLGQVADERGQPLVIEGLHDLVSGEAWGQTHDLYFSAGLGAEQHGVLGLLSPLAE